MRASVTLAITEAGLAALGIEAHSAPQATHSGEEATEASKAAPDRESPPAAATEAQARKSRAGAKQAALIDMLRTPDGATITRIAAATGWQSHGRGSQKEARARRDVREGRGARARVPGRVGLRTGLLTSERLGYM